MGLSGPGTCVFNKQDSVEIRPQAGYASAGSHTWLGRKQTWGGSADLQHAKAWGVSATA